MLRNKVKRTLKKILTTLIWGIIIFSISCLMAILVSHLFGVSLRSVMAVEGLVLAFIGMLLLPSGSYNINLRGLGQKDSSYLTYQDTETSRLEQQIERGDANYYKNFYSIREIFKNGLVFIIVGAAIFASAMYLYNY